jgi:hypothetical protein
MDINYFIIYDLPIPYGNIELYPITVKDYVLFNAYASCLSLDKNSIPDAKIIAMTYLEYIYYSAKDKPYLLWFDRVLSLSIKNDDSFEKIEESIKRYDYDEKGKPFFIIRGEKYTSKDFDEIRKIICQQNLIELPDTSISKEVRDSLEKAREYKNKISGSKPASFEDDIVALSIITGWSLEYVYSMSIRKFIKSIKRMDNLIHYKIYLTATMSGMVEFKDKSFIKHWLSDLENEDKYADVSISMDALQSKISLESAKK